MKYIIKKPIVFKHHFTNCFILLFVIASCTDHSNDEIFENDFYKEPKKTATLNLDKGSELSCSFEGNIDFYDKKDVWVSLVVVSPTKDTTLYNYKVMGLNKYEYIKTTIYSNYAKYEYRVKLKQSISIKESGLHTFNFHYFARKGKISTQKAKLVVYCR